MNNERKSPEGVFSRCPLGKNRWFWAAWADVESACAGAVHAMGIAATAAEAEQQAKDCLKAAFGCEAPWRWNNNDARYVYRKKVIKDRAERTSASTGASQREFVYHDTDSDFDNRTYSVPYRIVKKTKTRVYVETEFTSSSLRPRPAFQEDGKAYYDVRTFVLDRKELEETGRVYSRRMREFFYTTPYEERKQSSAQVSPRPFAVLGLGADCTEKDVCRQYRRLAKELHPDHGGDVEQFKRLHEAFEQALEALVTRG